MTREAGLGQALKMTTTPVVTGGTVPPAAASPVAKEKTAKAKSKRSKRHSPEQIVAKLRDAAAMLNAGKAIVAGRITILTVNGSVISGRRTGLGFSVLCGGIAVENDIGTATIRGSLIGNTSNPVQLFARGQIAPTAAVDLAIGKLNVVRRVEYGQILAGVNVDGSPVNADAQIGDWHSTTFPRFQRIA